MNKISGSMMQEIQKLIKRSQSLKASSIINLINLILSRELINIDFKFVTCVTQLPKNINGVTSYEYCPYFVTKGNSYLIKSNINKDYQPTSRF